MDLTAQIKNDLITRIKNADDLNFLHALQTLLDASEQSLYALSSEQINAIETGRNGIKEGQFHKNEAVILEMKQWLKKK